MERRVKLCSSSRISPSWEAVAAEASLARMVWERRTSWAAWSMSASMSAKAVSREDEASRWVETIASRMEAMPARPAGEAASRAGRAAGVAATFSQRRLWRQSRRRL